MNRPFAIGLGAALLLSCATTRVTDSWTNPAAQHPPLRKVLVAAQVPSETIRQRLEQELTAKLVAGGLDAVPSYQVLPPGQQVNAKNVREAVEQEGFEAAMVSRFAGIDQDPVGSGKPLDAG